MNSLLGLSFTLLLLSQNALAVLPFCKGMVDEPSRLERGIEGAESEKLKRFFAVGSKRYASNPEVLALAKDVEENIYGVINIHDSLEGLNGFLRFRRPTKDSFHVDVSTVQIITDAEKQSGLKYGRHSEGANTQFVKFMTGFIEGISRRAQKDPDLVTITIKAGVINESLANMLIDLGFKTPTFPRLPTPEEIEHMLTKNEIPKELRWPREKELTWKEKLANKVFGDLDDLASGKMGVQIPLEFTIELPQAAR